MWKIKFVGAILIILLILNMMPLNTINAEYQEGEDLKLYKTLLKRVLNLPDLDPNLRNRINKILNTHPTSRAEELSLIKEAMLILDDVRGYVEENMDLRDVVRRERLERIIDVLTEYAEEANATDIVESLIQARKYLDVEDIDHAESVLEKVTPAIKDLNAGFYSKELEDSILTIFNEASSNQTPIDAIINAIYNINITINILLNVREDLISCNASQESIMALDKAMEILSNVVIILNGTVTIIEKSGIGNKVGNITMKMAKEHIQDEINDLRSKIEKLMDKAVYLEENYDLNLTIIKNSLVNASSLLDESEDALNKGDLTASLKLLAMAKAIVHDAEEALEEYIEEVETELEDEEMEEYINGMLDEVKEEYENIVSKFQKLYNISIEYNCTEAVTLLLDINISINEVRNIIIEAEYKLNESSYEEALTLLKHADSMLDDIDKALKEVKNMLNVASQTLDEVIERINELRSELRELNETAWIEFKGGILNITLKVIMELNIQLNKAGNLTLSGDIDAAIQIIRVVEARIKGLRECIDSASELMDKIDELKSRIDELREKYSGIGSIEKLLDEAEDLINQALTLVEEAIDNTSPEILQKVDKLIHEINEIIESIEETHEYIVSFAILDENDLPVLNSSIIFNNTVYHNGEVTLCSEGRYNLTVGSIASGYIFDHWESYGDIEVMNPYSQTTKASIDGDGIIVLRVKKIIPTTQNYTVSFIVRDLTGKEISDAYIVLNGSEYHNGDETSIPAGEYNLSTGSIPDDYQFSFWASTGDIIIDNPMSNETIATIEGDGSIILVLKKSVEKANIIFYVMDVNGTILDDGSILFRGKEYSSGENITVEKDIYILSIGELPEGYRFIKWNSTGNITIADPTRTLTTADVSGDGEIMMVVEKIAGGKSMDIDTIQGTYGWNSLEKTFKSITSTYQYLKRLVHTPPLFFK